MGALYFLMRWFTLMPFFDSGYLLDASADKVFRCTGKLFEECSDLLLVIL